jgi:hypothetical protein
MNGKTLFFFQNISDGLQLIHNRHSVCSMEPMHLLRINESSIYHIIISMEPMNLLIRMSMVKLCVP